MCINVCFWPWAKESFKGYFGRGGFEQIERGFPALTRDAGAIMNEAKRRCIQEHSFQSVGCFPMIGGGARDRAALTLGDSSTDHRLPESSDLCNASVSHEALLSAGGMPMSDNLRVEKAQARKSLRW